MVHESLEKALRVTRPDQLKVAASMFGLFELLEASLLPLAEDLLRTLAVRIVQVFSGPFDTESMSHKCRAR